MNGKMYSLWTPSGSIGAGTKIFVFKDPKPQWKGINTSVNEGPEIICFGFEVFPPTPPPINNIGWDCWIKLQCIYLSFNLSIYKITV